MARQYGASKHAVIGRKPPSAVCAATWLPAASSARSSPGVHYMGRQSRMLASFPVFWFHHFLISTVVIRGIAAGASHRYRNQSDVVVLSFVGASGAPKTSPRWPEPNHSQVSPCPLARWRSPRRACFRPLGWIVSYQKTHDRAHVCGV